MATDNDDGKKRRQVVALGYEQGESPRVLAKGYGELAERIMKEAERQGLFVHDAPELVALLMQVDLDRQIPPGLYRVIGELLDWLHSMSLDTP